MDRAEMLDGAPPGPVRLVVPTFLIEHDDGLVLVDTGLAPEAARDPIATYGEVGSQVSCTTDLTVDSRLHPLGFAASDVSHVIVTHVHFDHTGGLRLFPDAALLLGEGDRRAAEEPATSEIAREQDLSPITHSALDTLAPMSADRDPHRAVASLRRLRAIAEEEGAQVWVAHDPDGWNHFGAPGEIA
jgi:glyoxylase-like metal-dependent hydrolase (beta-lactamase superfamily II)